MSYSFYQVERPHKLCVPSFLIRQEAVDEAYGPSALENLMREVEGRLTDEQVDSETMKQADLPSPVQTKSSSTWQLKTLARREE